MELASTCRLLGLRVTVVDVVPPLDRVLGRHVAGFVRGVAEESGARLVVSAGGARLLGTPEPTAVELASGERIAADLVISAVGDVANVEWLAGSGIDIQGGVVVDDRGRVACAALDVVATGDVAAVRDGQSCTRLATWTNAVEQSRVAAAALLRGDDAPAYRPSRYAWTEQFGLDIKLVGSISPGADVPAVLDGSLDRRSALLAWPDPSAATMVAAVNHPTPPAKLKRLLASG
ncbi:FAD-dependent oxidoreductase [Nocardia sp. NPDC051911]|uniref:FAD-dependent oxidoreductase n=1 Tax=Nocardia sp. NPDC051911 TaxID=3154648 RepID=UPI00341FC0B7